MKYKMSKASADRMIKRLREIASKEGQLNLDDFNEVLDEENYAMRFPELRLQELAEHLEGTTLLKHLTFTLASRYYSLKRRVNTFNNSLKGLMEGRE